MKQRDLLTVPSATFFRGGARTTSPSSLAAARVSSQPLPVQGLRSDIFLKAARCQCTMRMLRLTLLASSWGLGTSCQCDRSKDIDQIQWGHPPRTTDGKPLNTALGDDDNVPVFWGCGVTTQAAMINVPLDGSIMAHYPGEMLVVDCREDDVL